MEYTTIRIGKSTRDQLVSSGKKSETYDQILRRILDKAEASQ